MLLICQLLLIYKNETQILTPGVTCCDLKKIKVEYIEIRKTVLLSIQRALWGMIYPEIRAIAVGFENTEKLIVIYYLDREPQPEDFENLSDVTAEILCDIDFKNTEEKCIFTLEKISELNSLDSWVYIRKEF
jgi:hypothetical protein